MCLHAGEPREQFPSWGIRMSMLLAPSRAQLDKGSGRMITVTTIVDTGSNITIVKQAVAEEAGLKPIATRQVSFLSGMAPVYEYAAQLGCPKCDELRPVTIYAPQEVTPPGRDEPELYLGRDVLQHSSFSFDGPRQSWTLDLHMDRWPVRATWMALDEAPPFRRGA